jgi:hypothetical protein
VGRARPVVGVAGGWPVLEPLLVYRRCGVEPKDPVVAAAADVVRQHPGSRRCSSTTLDVLRLSSGIPRGISPRRSSSVPVHPGKIRATATGHAAAEVDGAVLAFHFRGEGEGCDNVHRQ